MKKTIILIACCLPLLMIWSCGFDKKKSEKRKFDNKDIKDLSEEVEKQCDHPSVKSIKTFIDHTNPSKGTFDYRYQIILSKEIASDKTVIDIPGGPGQNQIDIKSLDGNTIFSTVRIDPRGIGCNYHSSDTLPLEYLSTEQHVRDIQEVIKSLDPDDYVIYGVSYGTVVATHLSHNIAKLDDFPQPKAVVLEGIFGKHIKSVDYTRAFIKEFEVMNKRVDQYLYALGYSVENALIESLKKDDGEPFDISLEEWNILLPTLLSIGGNWW